MNKTAEFENESLLNWRLRYAKENYKGIESLIVVLAMCFFLSPFLYYSVLRSDDAIKQSSGYIEHTCTILETKVTKKQIRRNKEGFRGEVKISYDWNGKTYEIWTFDVAFFRGGGFITQDKTGDESARREAEANISGFVPGQKHRCYIRPDIPDRAVLVMQPYFTSAVFGFALFSLLFFWLAGVIYDCIRRFRRMRRIRELFREQPDGRSGTRLAFRLDRMFTEKRPGSIWYLANTVILLIVMVPFAVMFIERELYVFLLLLVPVAILVLCRICKIYRTYKLPPAFLELEKQPLPQSEPCKGVIIQPMSHPFEKISLELVCVHISERGKGKRRMRKETGVSRETVLEESFERERFTVFDEEDLYEIPFEIEIDSEKYVTECNFIQGKDEYDEYRWQFELALNSFNGTEARYVYPFVLSNPIINRKSNVSLERSQ